jgi:hypothetical protein
VLAPISRHIAIQHVCVLAFYVASAAPPSKFYASGKPETCQVNPALAARKADISRAISTGHIMCYRHC